MKSKICPICKHEFVPKSSLQIYCNQETTKICKVCGKSFTSICNANSPEVCSRKCASDPALLPDRVCKICGDTFHPNSSRQRYCNHIKQKQCAICGKMFEYRCGQEKYTCSKECQQKYAKAMMTKSFESATRICKECGKEFHPVNNTQIYCNNKHFRTCEICGKRFEIDIHKQDIPRTCSAECAQQLKFKNGNPFIRPDCREKAKQTMLARYGVSHPMQIPGVKDKIASTYLNKTGYIHPSHNPEVKSRAVKHAKQSKLEIKVAELFDEYKIQYVRHYVISKGELSHEFDFYLPKYDFLIDCDGIYYHAYNQDPDGKHVQDYYDEDRLLLIPDNWQFHVIVEGQQDKDIKYIVNCIQKIDSNVFDYEGELFKWCRSIDFPYPSYSTSRILADYRRLCNYDSAKYVPSARLGDSAISQYHKSIYDAHVGNYVSPKAAWYDDNLLKKVIKNRLIYKNDVDPYKIMKGFNISKICPRVSIFNPVLARYICNKYLSQYSQVFDPFSGYSGRLLGVSSTGKQYVGQDLNQIAVSESNQIIKDLDLNSATVNMKDILSSSGSYDCLLTCPPYNNKETYNKETVYKSCDDWIDECLQRFDCNRYVFVVDQTTKYLGNVVEEIKSTSHFCKVKELLIVIDK